MNTPRQLLLGRSFCVYSQPLTQCWQFGAQYICIVWLYGAEFHVNIQFHLYIHKQVYSNSQIQLLTYIDSTRFHFHFRCHRCCFYCFIMVFAIILKSKYISCTAFFFILNKQINMYPNNFIFKQILYLNKYVMHDSYRSRIHYKVAPQRHMKNTFTYVLYINSILMPRSVFSFLYFQFCCL